MDDPPQQTLKPLLDQLSAISLKDVPAILSSKTTNKLNGKKDIIFIESNTSIQEALEILSKNNLLSVPVRDHQDKFWIGFVDVLDILNFVIEMYTEGHQVQDQKWGTYCQEMETLSHRGIRFGIKPVSSIINESRTDSFRSVFPDGTVFQLMQELLTGKVHRAPIVDERNNITAIISQSDIIQLIAQNLNFLGSVGQKTVGELQLGTLEGLITMSVNAKAIHAYYLMYFHKVLGVGIVLPNGVLIGNLSASDIRSLSQQNFSSLLLPVSEYLRMVQGVNMKPPASVSLNTTLETVIQKLFFYRLHRLWIVNDKQEPVGVISLTDVIKFFSSFEA